MNIAQDWVASQEMLKQSIMLLFTKKYNETNHNSTMIIACLLRQPRLHISLYCFPICHQDERQEFFFYPSSPSYDFTVNIDDWQQQPIREYGELLLMSKTAEGERWCVKE